MELMWSQFKELLAVFNTIAQAQGNGVSSGELQNEVISAEWDSDKVEFTVSE